jgi:hypothetical protein
MNHSPKVIKEFICSKFGISPRFVTSENREPKYQNARAKIVILSGNGLDDLIADCLNRSPEDIRYIRRAIKGNMEFDKALRMEFETLKTELLKYEIS